MVGKTHTLAVKRSFDPGDIVVYAFLILVALSIIYPLYYMFIVSISNGLRVMRGEVIFFPLEVNWKSYQIIFSDDNILRAYANSIIYTVSGTLLALILTSLCAYPLSRKDFFGRKPFTQLIVFTMFFNSGIIPNFILIYTLGMYGTIWAIILPPAINQWYMIIMRTFFRQIPDDLHDSAFIDGANDFTIFLRIILPISKPIIATMTLFYSVWHWNSYFPALLYLNRKITYPLTIILRNIVLANSLSEQGSATAMIAESNNMVIGMNIKYAIIFITILPILTVYPFVQRYFVKGMLTGSLKG
jgi:putative aldouronate transport system permease protein